ncbi:hypothetical protein [Microcoleus sp. bin38.metabat.b11b12b14.051]|uniref:hypothetical protein n=1 Tax=Microcoleus sp. bin38.metabat.b11b12b14.051 TaxID=2742709 RepID=UPI0025F94AF1|nr:hypothetical protein [Microcoleus sp. bin38.metabat.b11b12b14.051]
MVPQENSYKGDWKNNLPDRLQSTHSQQLTIGIRTFLVDGKSVQIRIAGNGIRRNISVVVRAGYIIYYQIIQAREDYLRCTCKVGRASELMIKIPLKSKSHPQATCSEKFLVKL